MGPAGDAMPAGCPRLRDPPAFQHPRQVPTGSIPRRVPHRRTPTPSRGAAPDLLNSLPIKKHGDTA